MTTTRIIVTSNAVPAGISNFFQNMPHVTVTTHMMAEQDNKSLMSNTWSHASITTRMNVKGVIKDLKNDLLMNHSLLVTLSYRGREGQLR